MATGADILARFLPNLAETRSNLPDQGLQAQLLQNITNEQQRRIKEMGLVQASSAGAPWNGLEGAESGFFKGHDLAQSEEERARKMQAMDTTDRYNQAIADKLSADEAAKDDVDPNSRNGRTYREESIQDQIGSQALKYGSEEEHARYLNQADPTTGRTRHEMEDEAQYQQDMAAPGMARQRAQREQAESDQRIASSKAGTAQIYGGLANEAQDREASAFGKIIDGIATQYPPGQQRDQAIAAKVAEFQQHSKTGIHPAYFSSLASSTAQAHDAALASASASKEANTEVLPSFGALAKATSRAANSASAIDQLRAQAKDYNAVPTRFLGSQGSASLSGFIQTLHQLGAAGDAEADKYAQQLESHNIFDGTNKTIMQNAIKALTDSAVTSWNNDKANFPSMRSRGEYQQTEQLMQGLAQSNNDDGSGQGPQRDLFNQGRGNGSSRSFTQGNLNNPAGTAKASPAQGQAPLTAPPRMAPPGVAMPPPGLAPPQVGGAPAAAGQPPPAPQFDQEDRIPINQ